MRVLVMALLMACVSVCYAYYDHDKHKPGHYFVKVNGGYYPDYQYPRFTKYTNYYNAQYDRTGGRNEPVFDRYGRRIGHMPYNKQMKAYRYAFRHEGKRPGVCHDILHHNHTRMHGMIRCFNHEGLSKEYYIR